MSITFIIRQVDYNPSFVANTPTEEPRFVAHESNAYRFTSYLDAEGEIARIIDLIDGSYQIEKIYE